MSTQCVAGKHNQTASHKMVGTSCCLSPLYRFPIPRHRLPQLVRLRLPSASTRPPAIIDRQDSASYASISARRAGSLGVEVVSEAHRVLAGGVLSGYDAGLADKGQPGEDGVVFFDDSTAPADAGHGWGGTVTTAELPGGGLHRHVRRKADRYSSRTSRFLFASRQQHDATFTVLLQRGAILQKILYAVHGTNMSRSDTVF